MLYWLGYFFAGFLMAFTAFNFFIEKKTRFLFVKNPIRFGGVIFGLVIILTLTLISELKFNTPLWGFLILALVVIIFGFFDDQKNLSWKKQLIFQFFLGLVLILFGYQLNYISSPFSFLGEVVRLDFFKVNFFSYSINFLGSIVIIFWVIVMINAVNWADGIDGLLAGVGIIGFLAIFYISLKLQVNQPAIAIIALVFIGALLAFAWFNLAGKIQAGSAGSYLIGFSLAALSIISGSKIATTLIALGIVFLDFFWVILERFFKRIPLTQKEIGKRHLHYKLRQIGFTDRQIVLSYMFFSILAVSGSLWIERRDMKIWFLISELFVILFFLIWLKITKKLDFY